MKINVKNIKFELNNLNNIIEDYEDIYLNLYNEFSSSSFFWNDPNSKNFYRDIAVEKIKINETIDEIHSIANLYNYIVKQYEQIGNNIYYDLSNKYQVLNDIKNYQQKLRLVINKYNNLDTKSCPEITNYILNEKRKLQNSLVLINNIYKHVNEFYKQLESIEKEIKLRTSKINIDYIKENDVNDYV